jgi:glyoxylase I family protein
MSTARPWYELFVGRPEDNHPMETLVEWRITDRAWIQVFHDPDRAGSTPLNFAVDDLDEHVAELTGRGLALAASNRRTRV